MKQRGIAFTLTLLLIATALLSGALLILHPSHECHQAACPVCALLERGAESFLCLLIGFAGLGLLSEAGRRCLCLSPENRFLPDRTPVRLKVKLQD